MIRIGIIVGSTRPGRRCRTVAEWVWEKASTRDDAVFQIVDLADIDLPHLSEPNPAAMGPNYEHRYTREWAERIASCDGFIFVTPEYNHSIPGVLKNAIDHLYVEWHNKAAGFVSYGLAGGVRAVEHLRQIAAELQIADVRQQVALSLFTDFENGETFLPGQHHEATLGEMVDQLTSWAGALKTLRAARNPSSAAIS